MMSHSEITLPTMACALISEREAHLTFTLPENLLYFKGHFTGQPILAGVVQLKWAIEMSKKHLDIAGEFKSMEAIKFTKVLMPETAVTLVLVHDAPRNKVHFTYQSKAGQHSTGRVVFSSHV